jgi:hypothetical protein
MLSNPAKEEETQIGRSPRGLELGLSSEALEAGRYKREDGKVVIEVAVNTSRQLFNVRDPAPFRARDLDGDFVNYVLSSVQEFPLKTDMKVRIVVREENDQSVDQNVIREAIRAHFLYESRLVQKQIRKRLRIGRFYLVIGLLVLFVCLGIAHLLGSWLSHFGFGKIVGEGFAIIAWVAMWRPVEIVLYDWWPLRELKMYLAKVASTSVEIICSDANKNTP